MIFLVTVLYVWFNTDAFLEYSGFLPDTLQRLLLIDKYYEFESTCSYPEFLVDFKPSFITRLISCPDCLGFWLTLVFNSIHPFNIPSYYIGSLMIYYILIKIRA